MKSGRLFLGILGLCCLASPILAAPQWDILPPTPTLPKAARTGMAPIDGIRIWYAEFGHGDPVLLLHGGLANSNYWGNQVRALEAHHRVIVMDSRCHGRTTCDRSGIGYDLMAKDAVGLLDYLRFRHVALVGWSDGAIVGLDIAMHYPDRLTKLFAFAANYNTQGVADIDRSAVFTAFEARAAQEYAAMSPEPRHFNRFKAEITHMWAREPNWHRSDFRRITVSTWIADGDHDEAILLDQPVTMSRWIRHAGLLIEPDVNHFAFMQDPDQFTRDVEHFLEQR